MHQIGRNETPFRRSALMDSCWIFTHTMNEDYKFYSANWPDVTLECVHPQERLKESSTYIVYLHGYGKQAVAQCTCWPCEHLLLEGRVSALQAGPLQAGVHDWSTRCYANGEVKVAAGTWGVPGIGEK